MRWLLFFAATRHVLQSVTCRRYFLRYAITPRYLFRHCYAAAIDFSPTPFSALIHAIAAYFMIDTPAMPFFDMLAATLVSPRYVIAFATPALLPPPLFMPLSLRHYVI